MNIRKVFHHIVLLGFFNFIFLTCGIILLMSGFYLYMDTSRLLLSRLLGAGSLQLAELQYPLFYYIAIGLSTVGMVAVFASLIGFWAMCLKTYCILSFYFLLVLMLLLMEFGICLMITLWPHCLGLNLDEFEMVKILQGNYGVPGKEEFTVAMDLAQTKFNCCAINSNINYDTSLWKLQEFGLKEWPVPLTCCQLENRNEPNAFLDPKPVNITACESLQRHDYENARHTEGCLDKIDVWYRHQYILFLGVTLIVALIEFCVLLTIILNCTKLEKTISTTTTAIEYDQQSRKSLNKNRDKTLPNSPENVQLENLQNASNYIEPNDNREIYIQPIDSYRYSCNSSFRPSSKYQYQVTKSYLV